MNDGIYINLPAESGTYVMRDSQRTQDYIDTSEAFYLKGVVNGDDGYDGLSRDWRVVSGGTDAFSGDFVFSYNFEIVKRVTLEAIDALSAENVSSKNWFHGVTVSTSNIFDAWNDYSLIYRKSENSAETARANPLGLGSMTERDGFTATDARFVIVRSGNTLYIALCADNEWAVKTCEISGDETLYIFFNTENVNVRITDLTVSSAGSDVTAALDEIGKG